MKETADYINDIEMHNSMKEAASMYMCKRNKKLFRMLFDTYKKLTISEKLEFNNTLIEIMRRSITSEFIMTILIDDAFNDDPIGFVNRMNEFAENIPDDFQPTDEQFEKAGIKVNHSSDSNEEINILMQKMMHGEEISIDDIQKLKDAGVPIKEINADGQIIDDEYQEYEHNIVPFDDGTKTKSNNANHDEKQEDPYKYVLRTQYPRSLMHFDCQHQQVFMIQNQNFVVDFEDDYLVIPSNIIEHMEALLNERNDQQKIQSMQMRQGRYDEEQIDLSDFQSFQSIDNLEIEIGICGKNLLLSPKMSLTTATESFVPKNIGNGWWCIKSPLLKEVMKLKRGSYLMQFMEGTTAYIGQYAELNKSGFNLKIMEK